MASLGAERAELARYATHLEAVERLGVRQGRYFGLGLGATMMSTVSRMWSNPTPTRIPTRTRTPNPNPCPNPNPNPNPNPAPTPAPNQFVAYALAFYSGAGMLAADRTYATAHFGALGCAHHEATCLLGGDVVVVFFCMLMGSFALGQVVPNRQVLTLLTLTSLYSFYSLNSLYLLTLFTLLPLVKLLTLLTSLTLLPLLILLL